MRTVFFGSPEFAVPSLRALLGASEVVAVVTQPDKPAGRGQVPAPPPVKRVALEAGLPVLQPRSAKADELRVELAGLRPDLAVVAAYGKILPQALLDVPRLGCVNVHASILPRYRGAAPVQWAVIRGETETGVSLMRMEAGLDTGPVYQVRRVAIAAEDTGGSLLARLAEIGAAVLVEALPELEAGRLGLTPQDDGLATWAPMLKKETGRIDWAQPARAVRDLVRGVDPWPGAAFVLGGDPVKTWGARLAEGSGAPGTILGVDRDGLTVACATGAVTLAELQAPGKKRMHAVAFASGRPLRAGTVLP
jgi:methionyl-tRNA formyltransferase